MNQCWSFLLIAIKMAIVSLIGIYLVLTLLPYFMVEIAGHRVTVDLSYTMDNNVMKWITHRNFDIKVENGSKTIGNATVWYQSDELSFSTHTGTHLDAPIHFAKNRWTVDEIPLRNLVERPLAIVDIVDQAQSTRDYSTTVDDLKQWEEANGEIAEESVVIIRTGWSKFWPNRLDYFGTDTNDPLLAHFPGLHQDAARWLVQNRKVVGVGIDAPSIDCGQCGNRYGFPAHVVLSEANVYILENIEKSIFRVPNMGATITALAIKIAGASGSPVRAIAQYTHNHADTNLGHGLSPCPAVVVLLALLTVLGGKLH